MYVHMTVRTHVCAHVRARAYMHAVAHLYKHDSTHVYAHADGSTHAHGLPHIKAHVHTPVQGWMPVHMSCERAYSLVCAQVDAHFYRTASVFGGTFRLGVIKRS